ncbi:MAG: hypothetical protein K1X29_09880 [Bdellovibrionales bacterium]|nr:hypothetical protein [Bdellovibrionales bacterium]
MISLVNQILLSTVFLFSLHSKNLQADVFPWPWGTCQIPLVESPIFKKVLYFKTEDSYTSVGGFKISISDYFLDSLSINVIEFNQDEQIIAQGTTQFNSNSSYVSVPMIGYSGNTVTNYSLDITTYGRLSSPSNCKSNTLTARIGKAIISNGLFLKETLTEFREGESLGKASNKRH